MTYTYTVTYKATVDLPNSPVPPQLLSDDFTEKQDVPQEFVQSCAQQIRSAMTEGNPNVYIRVPKDIKFQCIKYILRQPRVERVEDTNIPGFVLACLSGVMASKSKESPKMGRRSHRDSLEQFKLGDELRKKIESLSPDGLQAVAVKDDNKKKPPPLPTNVHQSKPAEQPKKPEETSSLSTRPKTAHPLGRARGDSLDELQFDLELPTSASFKVGTPPQRPPRPERKRNSQSSVNGVPAKKE